MHPTEHIAFARAHKSVSTYMRALLMVSLVSLAACGGGDEMMEDTGPRPVAVRVVTPAVETLRDEAHYVGELGSETEITVVARLAGTVERLPKREGERVERGDLVVATDAPEQTARQRRAAAELDRAREESELACEQHVTNERLHARGALATLTRDQSETRCESSEGAVEAARSGLWELRAMGDKRRERSPIDGSVLAWLVQPGEHVVPGRPMLQLGSEAREVRVRIVEADMRRGIGVGTEARLVMADGSGRTASVTELSPASRGPAHTVEVTLALGDDPEIAALPHGSSVDVAFVLGQAQGALTVPVQAVQREREGRAVYVVDDRVARRRAIRELLQADGRVAIDGAVEPNDSVIVGDVVGLSDGTPVYPVREEAP